MTVPADTASANELAASLRAVDGVVQVFPRRPLVDVVRAVADVPPALVEVQSEGARTKVGARIGIGRAHPISAVIDRVAEAVPTALGDRPLQVEIEIAYIE